MPITFALTGSTLVTAVDHKAKQTRKLRRLDNIAREPRVTVLIDHYDDDWASLWWVRLRGIALVMTEGPRFAGAIAQLVAKYPQHYSRLPPEGPVIQHRHHRCARGGGPHDSMITLVHVARATVVSPSRMVASV